MCEETHGREGAKVEVKRRRIERGNKRKEQKRALRGRTGSRQVSAQEVVVWSLIHESATYPMADSAGFGQADSAALRGLVFARPSGCANNADGRAPTRRGTGGGWMMDGREVQEWSRK